MIENKYKLESEQLINSYKKMLLLRRFEEKCGQLYSMGAINGFCHLYIGQEAIVTGIDLVKDGKDAMITSYRDHGHAILSGVHIKYVLSELMGKSTGCSKGKGGSMHMFNAKGRFFGGHGIVGAQVSIGTGIAFAENYLNSNNICFTFLGDGAINQGQVYESFNMAALWKLPIIYIIENNEYSMGTSVKRSSAVTELYKKGQSFGINGYPVDGMDIEKVYNASKQAVEYVKSRKEPLILEMKTYRYKGHSMSDPAKYRTKEEVESYKQQDPIKKAYSAILDYKYANEIELKAFEVEIKNKIQEALDFSENSSLPNKEELYTDVYVNEV